MRVVVFCPDGSGGPPTSESAALRARIQETLTGGDGVEGFHVDWTHRSGPLREATCGAECLIVLLSDVPSSPPEELRGLSGDVPTVVVSPDPPAAALALRSMRVTELVDRRNLDHELAPLVKRVVSATFLGRARSAVRNVPGLSDMLRTWMLTVLNAFPPYPSIKASLERIGCSPSTLRRHWRSRIGRSRPFTFLRWVLLARAVQVKSPTRDWSDVAGILGVTRRRLRRTGTGLAGAGLDELEQRDVAHPVREACEAYLGRILLRGAPRRARS